ncbi:hypothetical protein OV203_49880 [Nannocystis sp. ILAH1]|uniref:hypothetical protein n=1 Tax=Nannocystis sp. ILAH1 TaxID=2996789 RepID=UPI0022705D9C|nr:hypothetical protein [Nannocystis sp. ILAH1]MCY0995336.1 hypothetical protein [Nannocystis sp. ILAH1]
MLRVALSALLLSAACDGPAPAEERPSTVAPPPAIAQEPAPPPASPPKDSQPPPVAARKRGPHEIDEHGVGPLRLGMRDQQLGELGLHGDHPQGSASFVQDGKPSPITFRMGGTRTLEQDGQPQIVADVDPVEMRVTSLRIVGPVPKTAEGVGVGAALQQVRTIYGEPEHTWGPVGFLMCAQFAARPGVDVCFQSGTLTPIWADIPPEAPVAELRVPATRPSPLTLGEDLAQIAAALQGHLIDGGLVEGAERIRLDGEREPFELLAPCVLLLRSGPGKKPSSWSSFNAVVRGGEVYQVAGGWRRADGSMLLCDGNSVFVRDADGTAVRWRSTHDQRWQPEPATCDVHAELVPPRVVCKGITDPFRFKAVMMGELIVAEQYADDLAERRAVHRDRRAGPFTPEGQCQRIADRAWEETVPALAFAGAPTDLVARLHYLQASSDVIASCSAEPLEQRLCALTTPEFFEAARACPSRLARFPDWMDVVREPFPRPTPMPPAELKRRTAALTGTWSRVHADERMPPEQWTFSSGGRRLQIHGGPDEGSYELSPTPEGAWIARRPLRELWLQLAFLDADHFYDVDSPMARLVDRQRFDVRLAPGREVLLMRGQVCKTVTAAGQLHDARCRFVTDDTGERLEVEYTDDEGGAATTTLAVVDGFLAPLSARPQLALFARQR